MSKDTGGSAFPRSADKIDDGCEGMTLRDYFAAQALPLCMRDNAQSIKPEIAAKEAYKYADAMIAEKEKVKK